MDNIESISDEQISKAIAASRKLETDTDKQLLVDDDELMLQFSYNKIPKSGGNNSKLIKMVFPHQYETGDVCLFVGDGPDKNKRQREAIADTIQNYEEQIQNEGLSRITEVIPLLKLTLEYQTYESRRKLVSRFDTFMADDSILRLLPALLGKVFYGKQRNHPVPVRIKKRAVGGALRKALKTKMCVLSTKGACNAVAVAKMTMSDAEMVDNIRLAMNRVKECIPGGKDNIRSFHVGIKGRVMLPIYLCSAEESKKIEVPVLAPVQGKNDEPLIEEVSTVNGKVSVGKDGSITIYRDGKAYKLGEDPVQLAEDKKAKEESKKRGKKRAAKANSGEGDKSSSAEGDKKEEGATKPKKPRRNKTKTPVEDKKPQPAISEKAVVTEDKEEMSEGEYDDDMSSLEFSSDADSEAGDASEEDGSPNKESAEEESAPLAKKGAHPKQRNITAAKTVSTPLTKQKKTVAQESPKSAKKGPNTQTPAKKKRAHAGNAAEKKPQTPAAKKGVKPESKTPVPSKKPQTPAKGAKTLVKTPGTAKKMQSQTPPASKKTDSKTPNKTAKTPANKVASVKKSAVKKQKV